MNLLKKGSQKDEEMEINKKEILKMNKTNYLVNTLLLILVMSSIFLMAFLTIPSVSAQAVTTCCERTVEGAYCQNVPSDQCDSSYLSSPTSCDSTSFCQLGTCYDSDEGLCMDRTPKKACEEANGLWTDEENPPQCELGCCVIGEQAAFTTFQRCKKISGGFGLQADFRKDIADEISCIAIANAQDVGACVFESEFTRTCSFGTRGECDSESVAIEGEEVTSEGKTEFFKDFLCTSEQLATNCQRTEKTTCVDGKDGVYFVDTCENTANIYDASKISNQDYWEKVVPVSSSCEGDPRTCGNCDYLGGSICASGERGEKANYGDFVCKDINCYDVSTGEDYINGESWCAYDNDKPDDDRVGSRHFRHICFMGEEIVEACADLRKEVCVEDAIDTESGEAFSQAGCVINRWQDCLLQERMTDCVNTDQRDCKWIPVTAGEGDIVADAVDKVTQGVSGMFLNVYDSQRDQGACVPDIAPGLPFWGDDTQGDAAAQCDLVSSSCVITYEKKLIGGSRTCIDNCFCDIEENPQTAIQAMNICSSIGDCGPGANYQGKFINKGYEFAIEDEQIGPDLDLGILNPRNAKDAPGGAAQPSNAPVFDQGASQIQSEGGVPNTAQPTPLAGNVIKSLYRRMAS